MENQETKKRNPFLMKIRKIAISLKRNFYTVPLICTAICTIQMTCSLYIYSPLTPRISSSKFNAFFVFLLTLFSIISAVNYLFYTQKVKASDKKGQIIFLVLFYILVAAQIAVEVPLLIEASNNIGVEQAAYDLELANNGSNLKTILHYLDLSKKAYSRYLTHIIMVGITSILVAFSPLIQKQLKKVKFKKISYED